MSTVIAHDGHALDHSPGHHDPVELRSFGFWLYILSDLVLFALLFCTYALLRHNFADGPRGRELFDIPFVFTETMLLLVSSATCGMAYLSMHRQKARATAAWLTVTFLLGLGFVVMEVSEFRHLVLEGHGPSQSAFLSSFFTLVGTHGAHVCAGLLWALVMIVQALTMGVTMPVQSRLIRFCIFWHFLDVVWVGVFSLVYLTGAIT